MGTWWGRGRRRWPALLAGQLLLVAGLRVAVLQPERCPAPDAGATDAAVGAAVRWFADNQQPDGRWRYRYDATAERDLGGYNEVRHAGVLLSLEQAAAAGFADAAPVADAGWAHLEALLRDAGDGSLAVTDGSDRFDTGAAALAAAAWVDRLARRPDAGADRLLRVGRFLAGQVVGDGAVAAYRDRESFAPGPERSRFSTGETAWALQRLADRFPGAGFAEPADRTLRYVATRRDAVERWFPAIADHWAAYALAAADEGGEPDGDVAHGDDVQRYRQTLAGRFAIQVRWESQRRPGRAWSDLTRARPATGAAIGTLGEGLGRLAAVAPPGPWRDGLRRQQACVAGLLVQRQSDPGAPAPVAGAWLADGVTQMDDQQHALSALLAYREVVAAGERR
ncbi:MAG: hypothetical protein IT196_24290 [Acidimicrobiales bacterium]|nr:hypothetical protein [Acidimicrobiales bacterium]